MEKNNTNRTSKATKNIIVSVFAQIVILLVSFINRTIFIKLLGAEYLGVDGLFSSILLVFSIAELGIGNAIIFKLYQPIAQNNVKKVQQYITLFERAYNGIILFIITIGICLLPFIKQIVQADELSVDINIYVVFLLFLLNTVSTYFLAHRQSVLLVNQKQHIVSYVQMWIKCLFLALESLLLLVWKNYYLYLFVKVSGNYVQAIILSVKAKKEYPIHCKKNTEKLSKNEMRSLVEDVKALVLRRIGSVVLASADNIIINTFISTVMVGIYSNYTLIKSSVQTIVGQAFSALTATIGNYIATEKKEKVEELFGIYTFMIYVVYGFCCICLYTLTNRFIELMWGKEYLLSSKVLFVIVFDFLLYGFQTAINVFRDASGLFVQGKYRPFVSACVNIFLSVFLAKPLGVFGIILATVLSRVFVSVWYDPYILYKHCFEGSVKRYFFRLASYLGMVVCICISVDKILCGVDTTIFSFIGCGVVSVMSTIILICPFIKSKEFIGLLSYIKSLVGKYNLKKGEKRS